MTTMTTGLLPPSYTTCADVVHGQDRALVMGKAPWSLWRIWVAVVGVVAAVALGSFLLWLLTRARH